MTEDQLEHEALGWLHIQRIQETPRRDGVIVTATCSLCHEPLKQKNPPAAA